MTVNLNKKLQLCVGFTYMVAVLQSGYLVFTINTSDLPLSQGINLFQRREDNILELVKESLLVVLL